MYHLGIIYQCHKGVTYTIFTIEIFVAFTHNVHLFLYAVAIFIRSKKDIHFYILFT